MAQSGFASNIFKQAENEMAEYGEGSGSEYTASDVLADGPLYYEDWGGLWKNDGTQGDGVYLIEATSEILTVRNGEPVSRQKINIAKPKVKT
jgi:hypothetical protein